MTREVLGLTYSFTDNSRPPVPVSDWLILCCGNLVLHQKKKKKKRNEKFYDKKQQKKMPKTNMKT